METETISSVSSKTSRWSRLWSYMLPAFKIALYAVLALIAVGVSGVIPVAILSALRLGDGLLKNAAIYLFIAPAVVGVTCFVVRFIDRRPTKTIGISRSGSWLLDLIFGAVLSVMIVGLLFVVKHFAFGTRITATILSSSISTVIFVSIASAFYCAGAAIVEEVVCRGYVLHTLRISYGIVPAIVISATLFALPHLGNRGAGLFLFTSAFGSGLVYAYAYLATDRLWLPIGLHAGWNYAIGTIFGFQSRGSSLMAWVVQTSTGSFAHSRAVEIGLWLLAMILLVLGVKWFKSNLYRPDEVRR
jgi:membrane protease YdiL (CAAX protease family)